MERPRSKLLLKLGIAAGVVGLGVTALGAYSVNHTSQNVARHRDILDRLKVEGDNLVSQPRDLRNQKRLLEIPQEQQTIRAFLAEYESDRTSAVAILAVGLIVLFAGGVCVAAYFVRRPGPPPDASDEGEEDEPRRRARKQRPKDR